MIPVNQCAEVAQLATQIGALVDVARTTGYFVAFLITVQTAAIVALAGKQVWAKGPVGIEVKGG